MQLKKFSILFTFILFFKAKCLFALVPLESLIIGDLTDFYREKSTDPIDYIFSSNNSESDDEDRQDDLFFRKRLSIYRGFYNEGENLRNFCFSDVSIKYANQYEEDQMLRSLLATLQFIGLDLTSRAIPKYANKLDFSQSDWNNLLERLIGNYCSKNLSVISLKQLKKYMNVKFNKANENTIILPTVKDDPFFPKNFSSINDPTKVLEQELLMSVKLFRAVCSWGGEITNFRLLTPLLNNEVVMSHVIRKMSGKTLGWNSIDNTIYIQNNSIGETPILCDNLICRKQSREVFEKKYFKSAGHKSLYDDMQRLYCRKLRNSEFKNEGQIPQIKKWIEKTTFDDLNLLVSWFNSLVTTVPDIFIRLDKFSDSSVVLRSTIDENWDNWAKSRIESLNKNLMYEEPLSIELVSRDKYFNKFRPNFKLMFDVNLGEMDRSINIVGKIKTTINLKFKKSFLKWARQEWSILDRRNKRKYKHLINVMNKNIEDKLLENRDKFVISPWDGKIEPLISKELYNQLVLYEGSFFTESSKHNEIKVPIVISYAPFALRYLKYERDILNAQKKEVKKLSNTYDKIQ